MYATVVTRDPALCKQTSMKKAKIGSHQGDKDEPAEISASMSNSSNPDAAVSARRPKHILDFFSEVQNNGKRSCLLCFGSSCEIGENTSSGNYHRHVHSKHREHYMQLPKSLQLGSLFPTIQTTLDHPRVPTKDDRERRANMISEVIIEAMLPFSFVEQPAFIKLIHDFDPKMSVPCRQTITQRVMSIYDQKKLQIRDVIDRVEGKVNITTDLWTSMSMQPFLGVTVHFVDGEWRARSLVLAMEPFKAPHNRNRVHEMITHALLEFGIDGSRVVSVTTDNASNIISAPLPNYADWLCPQTFHIRCLGHCINLVVARFLKDEIVKNELHVLRSWVARIKKSVYLKQHLTLLGKERAEQSNEDGHLQCVDEEKMMINTSIEWLVGNKRATPDKSPTNANFNSGIQLPPTSHKVGEHVLGDSDVMLLGNVPQVVEGEDIQQTGSGSDTIGEVEESTESASDGKPLSATAGVILDVCTRWNSTFLMCERVYRMRRVLDKLAVFDDAKAPVRINWTVIRELMDILRPFHIVTERLSADKKCIASRVLFMLDSMVDTLHKQHSQSTILREPTRKLLTETEKLLWPVHPALFIAAVLDPRFKNVVYNNFVRSSDPASPWRIFEAVLDSYNPSMSTGSDTVAKNGSPLLSTDGVDLEYAYMLSKYTCPEMSLNDELHSYLRMPQSPAHIDPLNWWREMRGTFPILSRMARDFLSIMPTSVSSERAFSAMGRLITVRRSSLGSLTSKKTMCAYAWSRFLSE